MANIRLSLGSSDKVDLEKLKENEKKYIERRMQKLESLLEDAGANEVRVDLDIDNDKRNMWNVSMNVTTAKKMFRVKKQDRVLMTVVSAAETALTKQIRKHFDKKSDFKSAAKAREIKGVV